MVLPSGGASHELTRSTSKEISYVAYFVIPLSTKKNMKVCFFVHFWSVTYMFTCILRGHVHVSKHTAVVLTQKVYAVFFYCIC